MAANNNAAWNILPSIIVIEIFSFLSLKDRLQASLVCKAWRECLFHPSLWHTVVLKLKSCDNSRQQGNESAQFLVKRCGRYFRNVIIEVNSQNPRDAKDGIDILNILAYNTNSNIKALSLRPKSCRLEWIDNDAYEETLPDQYVSALKKIICSARRLQHISLGCVEEILDYTDSFLSLLGQHQAKSLESLHLASVKENPDSYGLLDVHADMFDPFCNLQSLSIDYDYLSDSLLLVLAKPYKRPISYFNVHVHGIDTDHPGTSDNAWKQLCNHCPSLKLTITILHSNDNSTFLEDIFLPSMPLTHFRSYFSPGVDATFLDLLAALNSNTLQSITIVESLNEDFSPSGNFFSVEEDPLVMLAWRCQKLCRLTVIGYEVNSANLIAIARLRGNKLKELKIPTCCIAVSTSDDDVPVYLDDAAVNVRTDLIEEVSHSLEYQWIPLTQEDLPPSVANVLSV